MRLIFSLVLAICFLPIQALPASLDISAAQFFNNTLYISQDSTIYNYDSDSTFYYSSDGEILDFHISSLSSVLVATANSVINYNSQASSSSTVSNGSLASAKISSNGTVDVYGNSSNGTLMSSLNSNPSVDAASVVLASGSSIFYPGNTALKNADLIKQWSGSSESSYLAKYHYKQTIRSLKIDPTNSTFYFISGADMPLSANFNYVPDQIMKLSLGSSSPTRVYAASYSDDIFSSLEIVHVSSSAIYLAGVKDTKTYLYKFNLSSSSLTNITSVEKTNIVEDDFALINQSENKYALIFKDEVVTASF